jgi:hypothetical protein
MTKKWIAVNLLLLVIAALSGWQLRRAVLQFDAQNDLAKIQPSQSIKKQMAQDQEKAVPKLVAGQTYNPAEFTVIPEKNVFSESRSKEEKVPEDAAPPEPPPLTQKPILVGVTMIDSQYRASIIDPGSPQEKNERSRRSQIKKVGDVYRGYTITSISSDRIILESGTRKEIIPLREGSKKGRSGKTAILSTRVVPFGGGGTTGGTPVAIVGGGAPPRTASAPGIGRPTVPIAAAEPAGSAETPAPASASAARDSGPQPAPAVRTAPAPGASRSPTDSQGRQVIKTPFGDIVRPNR